MACCLIGYSPGFAGRVVPLLRSLAAFLGGPCYKHAAPDGAWPASIAEDACECGSLKTTHAPGRFRYPRSADPDYRVAKSGAVLRVLAFLPSPFLAAMLSFASSLE